MSDPRPGGLRRRPLCGALALLLGVAGLAPEALLARGEPKPRPRSGQGWVTVPRPPPEAVEEVRTGLAAPDAARRRAAAEALVRLGVAALRPLYRELPLPGPHASGALLDALETVGLDDVLGTVLAERSHYVGRYEREVEAFVAALRARRDRTAPPRVAVLEAAVLRDPEVVPPLLAHDVSRGVRVPGLPTPLALGAPDPARGRVLLAPDGTALAVLPESDAPVTFDVPTPSGARPWLLWRRAERWFAAPAALVRGEVFGVAVEVLDADGDGRFGGPADLVRFGDGAFRPVEDGPYGWNGADLVRVAFASDGPVTRVTASREPWPPGVSEGARGALTAVNRWRNLVGLVPKPLDVPHSEQCQLHAEYLRQNGELAHEERPGAPGYTEAGAEAGISSTVWPGDPATQVDVITRTVVHRVNTLSAWHEGYGVGYAGASVLWGGRTDTGFSRHPVLVPAPGRTEVPTAVERELPDPQGRAGFYTRARGYPVTVLWDRHVTAWSEVRLELFEVDGRMKPLSGVLFRPGAAYLESDPQNQSMLAFVADRPLASRRQHLVRVSATTEAGLLAFEWTFRTR